MRKSVSFLFGPQNCLTFVLVQNKIVLKLYFISAKIQITKFAFCLTFLAEVKIMLDVSAINPYIRVAVHSVIPAHYEINRRIIFDYELIYVANGEFMLSYNGIDYNCKKGQFILLRPGVPHRFWKIENDLTQPHIHFDITHISDSVQVPVSFKDINALTDKEKNWIRDDVFSEYPKIPTVFFLEKDKALNLFYETIDSSLSILTRKSKLIQLIEMLINDNFSAVLKKQPNAYRIEKYIKDYIDAGQCLNAKLEDIAKQFNYSKYYLDRCFKESYGVGIMAYRNEKRMQKAKEMLKHYSVSVVSEKMGFSSIYVFSRAFKNRFGVSPTQLTKVK